jgi:hypothetical protein
LSELISPVTRRKHFKCQLEYLLFRAGFFFLQPTNISHHHICSNHLKCLLSTTEKSRRCKLCVPIRNQSSAGQSGLRRVSKTVALGIWEEGQPSYSWVVFDCLACVNCRRFFERKHLNDSMRQKSDQLFGECWLESVSSLDFFYFIDWLYDCHVVHTPTVFSRSSQGQNFDIVESEESIPQENLKKRILDKALWDTGFTDYAWMTSSFTTMKPQSRLNFLSQMEKIIQHAVKIYAPIDYKDVHVALIE